MPEFNQIVASEPVVVPPSQGITYDTWWLDRCNIMRVGDKYDMEVFFRIGTIDGLNMGPKTTSYIIRDLLATETLAAYPMIQTMAPQLLSSLAAAGAQIGVL